jgi:hypothetical protein
MHVCGVTYEEDTTLAVPVGLARIDTGAPPQHVPASAFKGRDRQFRSENPFGRVA